MVQSKANFQYFQPKHALGMENKFNDIPQYALWENILGHREEMICFTETITYKLQRVITPKVYKQELCSLHSVPLGLGSQLCQIGGKFTTTARMKDCYSCTPHAWSTCPAIPTKY